MYKNDELSNTVFTMKHNNNDFKQNNKQQKKKEDTTPFEMMMNALALSRDLWIRKKSPENKTNKCIQRA